MWMRVDDGLHAHRKTRAVTKSHDEKRRDAGPMGLWVLAGSWSGRNNQDGWVPCEELDRFDDDWEELAARLVEAGFWWPEDRDGEQGYGFNDWGEWNNPTGPSASGTFGNHIRWHANKGVVKADCEHCPTEPMSAEDEEAIGASRTRYRGDHRPDIAPDSGGESGGESLRDHRPESLTRPEPDPSPTRADITTLSDESDDTDSRFDEFWDTYGHKVDRKSAQQKWRLALRKPGVTADMLIAAAHEYVTFERQNNQGGRFIMGPAKWLLNERWNDERASRRPPQTRVQEHLSLVQQLAAEEAEAEQPTLPQIGRSYR